MFLKRAALSLMVVTPALALNGGTLRVAPANGGKAFEVVTEGDNPTGDGFAYAMPGTFDGAGAWRSSS